MSTNNTQLVNLTNELRGLNLNVNLKKHKKHGKKCELNNRTKKYEYDIIGNKRVDLICKKTKQLFGRKLKSSLKKKTELVP